MSPFLNYELPILGLSGVAFSSCHSSEHHMGVALFFFCAHHTPSYVVYFFCDSRNLFHWIKILIEERKCFLIRSKKVLFEDHGPCLIGARPCLKEQVFFSLTFDLFFDLFISCVLFHFFLLISHFSLFLLTLLVI